MVELALSSFPGLYSLGPPQSGSAFGVYWPALIDQRLLDQAVHHYDGSTEVVPALEARDAAPAPEPLPEQGFAPPSGTPSISIEETVAVPLGQIVHARSGDKGGDANLGVWVRDRGGWDWLRSNLTTDELRRLLPETQNLEISRYELPNLGAINFLIRGLLGTGATSSLRLDSQAKALGEWLRSRTIEAPPSLIPG
jgi:hypothetical protein